MPYRQRMGAAYLADVMGFVIVTGLILLVVICAAAEYLFHPRALERRACG